MYLLASAWKFVYEGICLVRDKGLSDRQVYQQLKDDQELSHLYLTVFELQKKIVDLGQHRLRLKMMASGEEFQI